MYCIQLCTHACDGYLIGYAQASSCSNVIKCTLEEVPGKLNCPSDSLSHYGRDKLNYGCHSKPNFFANTSSTQYIKTDEGMLSEKSITNIISGCYFFKDVLIFVTASH